MILFFSGTGNSSYVAKALALYTGEKIVSMNEGMKSGEGLTLHSETPYLIVAPTYAWRMPRVVEKYLKKCHFTGSDKVYFFLTCGANTGNAEHYIENLAQEMELTYMGFSPIVMPDNYIIMYDADSGEKAETMIHNAGLALKEDVEHILEELPLPGMRISMKDRLISGPVNAMFYKLFVSDKGFWSSDACVGCGACVKACPLNNIKLEEERPVWQGNCTHCLACISRCPYKAIEYKKATAQRARYYNNHEPENV